MWSSCWPMPTKRTCNGPWTPAERGLSQPERVGSAGWVEVLAGKVHRHLGLDFSGARRADLERRLGELAQEQEGAPATWLEDLAFADWDGTRLQLLTPAFTVG